MRSQSTAGGQDLKQEQSSPSSKDPSCMEIDIGEQNSGEQPKTGSPPIEQKPPAP